MLRLSIIVPFYNVEPYIEECIRSLYAQDIPLDDYEVICVDDCSPDGSRAIVERLQKEFPTLKLTCHDKNKKVGGARNTGVKEAKGKNVWFVDSDDYIYPNVLRRLLDIAEQNNLDILQFNHVKGEISTNDSQKISDITTGEDYLFNHVTSDWYDKIGGAWKQLFKHDFLFNASLEFIEGAMYEDTDYLLHAFLAANKVQYISLTAYHYRINNESITITPVTPMKLAWHVNQIIRCGKLVDKPSSLAAKETIATMVSHTLSQLRKDVAKFSMKEKLVYINHLEDIQSCKKFMSWRTWLAIRYGITWFV